MGEMPTFGSADIELIMELAATRFIMPDDLKKVKSLRDRLDAAIEYCSADYEDDDYTYDDDDSYEPYDDDDE